jgi:hypothetical protein
MASMTEAAVRAADSLLRTVGGRRVLLRVPAAANPDDDGEQLGLATPQFQDSDLCPVVFRRVRPRVPSGLTNTASAPAVYELLVSVTAVSALVGALGYDSAETLFAVALGVVLPDTALAEVLLEIVSATWSEVGGGPYLYRLVLRAPLALRT